jgi:hypothetical protein
MDLPYAGYSNFREAERVAINIMTDEQQPLEGHFR